jgi:hypothetical protein
MQHDAMLIVRSNMIRHIEAIAEAREHMCLAELCDKIDAIRHDARLYGMEPVERMASMLESALAMGGVGPIVTAYLEMMRDAVGCEDASEAACSTYLAALSLRVGY